MEILYINQAVYYIFLLILYLAINAIIECIVEIKKKGHFFYERTIESAPR